MCRSLLDSMLARLDAQYPLLRAGVLVCWFLDGGACSHVLGAAVRLECNDGPVCRGLHAPERLNRLRGCVCIMCRVSYDWTEAGPHGTAAALGQRITSM